MQMWVEARVGNSTASLRLYAPPPAPRILPFSEFYVLTFEGCIFLLHLVRTEALLSNLQ